MHGVVASRLGSVFGVFVVRRTASDFGSLGSVGRLATGSGSRSSLLLGSVHLDVFLNLPETGGLGRSGIS